ncbi:MULTISPECIES: MarR family winged helix-turn-helix transcriptional regulator [Thermomonosporaceae]|uniref:MarR family winged helix-turn-helix transcriptional regulator n=1 Tax=Thermomonosporaceae TaxID=2012 RepID=UPI00255AFEBF|nr:MULTISPECIES: MarR family transcriptional regulator [Thermomonosporaceae]MDL4776245.1 MarR family transcriptional regulator [Actinomadura xylanilytica]
MNSEPDGALLGHQLSLWVVLYHEALASRLHVNATEHKVLGIIGRARGVHPAQLVAETGLSDAAITKIVDRLVSLGYVDRARDPSDGRRFTLTVTAVHRQVTAEAMAPMLIGMEHLLQGFDAAELETVGRWLTGTVAVMREATLSLAPDTPQKGR